MLLASMVFHLVTGRWLPACLLAATASVETVSPPEDSLQRKVSNGCQRRQTPGIQLVGTRGLGLRRAADDGLRKALHFFELGAELQQNQVHARGFELRDALGYLLRSSDQS